MNTPFDLEERLRQTFDDIVPQLVARARVTQEVSLIGEEAPPRERAAGAPRRWSLLGAAAAIAVLAAVVWAVSRSDDSATVPAPATVATTSVTSTDATAASDAIPEWYTILRQAAPARFTNLAITRIEPHLARFVAIDMELGEVLDLIVRDVPGPAVEITCEALAADECTFSDAEHDAVVAAIPPGQLGAAARDATLVDLADAKAAIAAVPGWKVVSETAASAADTTLVIDTGATEVTLRVVGGVMPPAQSPVMRVAGQTAAWGIVGQYLLVGTAMSPMSAYEALLGATEVLALPADSESATTIVNGPEQLEFTDGAVWLPDGTAFRLYEDSGGYLCIDELGVSGSCQLQSGGGEWPAEIFWHPWSTGMFVYGLLEEPYVVTASAPSSSVVHALTVAPSQVDGIWICYGVLPSDPHYTVTVSTAAGTVVATQTLH